MAEIPFGFTYDTVQIGQVSRTHGRTITDTDITFYMMLTGGWHPVHCDREFMRRNGLGPVRAQGSFGIAISLGSHLEAPLLRSADPLVGALGVKEWTYLGPIFVGDTLHIEVEIVDKKLTSDGKRYVVDRQITLLNQKGKAIQKGIARSMWRRADA